MNPHMTSQRLLFYICLIALVLTFVIGITGCIGPGR
jgi:hypothetical protein